MNDAQAIIPGTYPGYRYPGTIVVAHQKRDNSLDPVLRSGTLYMYQKVPWYLGVEDFERGERILKVLERAAASKASEGPQHLLQPS